MSSGRDLSAFSDGLIDWVHGVDSDDAEAAGALFGETVLLVRKYVKEKFKKGD